MDEFDNECRDLDLMSEIYETLDEDDLSACYYMALVALSEGEPITDIHNEIMGELSNMAKYAVSDKVLH
jgi:hypothetical protein